MPEPDIYWPYAVLPPRKVMAEVVPATTGGGRSITAVEQVVSYDAGYWEIDLDEIPFASRAHKLAWREVAAVLNGRLGTCAVPVYDSDTAPWALDANGKLRKVGGSIVGQVYVDAVLGATTVQLLITSGGALQAGQDWSVVNRLYRIKSITSQAAVSPGIVYTVKVTPPLREAIPGATMAEFEQPRCICRLKTDTEMQSGVDDYAGRTLAKVTFVELLCAPGT